MSFKIENPESDEKSKKKMGQGPKKAPKQESPFMQLVIGLKLSI